MVTDATDDVERGGERRQGVERERTMEVSISRSFSWGHIRNGRAGTDELSPVRSLPSTLPTELLRGVPAASALEGYGKHWRRHGVSCDGFEISEETGDIDDFISHDWRTPGKLKYIALCWLYNLRPAIIASVTTGISFSVMCEFVEIDELLRPCEPACLLVFLFVIFHWHKFVAFVNKRSRMLFLDKLCIDQEDAKKKELGILGLAVFLTRSRRMVVLWSPTYFSRLWCTYELATWFHLERPLQSMVFVPVMVPAAILGSVVLVSVVLCGRAIMWHGFAELPNHLDAKYKVLTYGLAAWASAVIAAFILQVLQEELKKLSEQLKNFSIRSTSCYCCSNEHKHPETLARIPCDRKLIYKTLDRWCGPLLGPDTTQHDHLDAFDDAVRSILRYHIMNTATTKKHVKYSNLFCVGLPFLWDAFDDISVLDILLLRDFSDVPLAFDYLSLLVTVTPISLRLCALATSKAGCINRWTEGSRGRKLVAALFVWAPLFLVFLTLTAFTGPTLRRVGAVKLHLAWHLLLVAITCYLFAGHRKLLTLVLGRATLTESPHDQSGASSFSLDPQAALSAASTEVTLSSSTTLSRRTLSTSITSSTLGGRSENESRSSCGKGERACHPHLLGFEASLGSTTTGGSSVACLHSVSSLDSKSPDWEPTLLHSCEEVVAHSLISL
eukprot:TRINITY_DN2638_c0_g1_i1.p1 TRINITY_DN2638_c0_g1~~TRINITY_DN2638_c0_g1_i1.p1  ORF type:complete len:670 (-),score=69.24 TRINITY_DN2638_c0_g1_i1:35-2044(-)